MARADCVFFVTVKPFSTPSELHVYGVATGGGLIIDGAAFRAALAELRLLYTSENVDPPAGVPIALGLS